MTPPISLIVAVADNDVIGKKGSLLPWRLSGDLAHFKQVTTGHPVIMGRATYETIGQSLAGRQNIIITHDRDYTAEGCEVVHSVEEALRLADGAEEVFIIGGGTIFEQTLPLASKIYLTRVRASPEGDTFFRYDPEQWSESGVEPHPADDKNQYAYTFSTLTRR
jgi:dihydrofolate reductase